MSYTVEVAGKNMQPDFEPVFERKIHSFLNCVEGLMHTGQRDMIRVRISKADFEAGFKFRHIGEVLYAKIKSEFDVMVLSLARRRQNDRCTIRKPCQNDKDGGKDRDTSALFHGHLPLLCFNLRPPVPLLS